MTVNYVPAKVATIIEANEDAEACTLCHALLTPKHQLKTVATLVELDSSLVTLMPWPDLLITDRYFRDGDVLEYAEQRQLRAPLLPFLVVSRFADYETMKQVFELGAIDFITAAYVENELLVKVEAALTRESLYTTQRSRPILDQTSNRVAFKDRLSPRLTPAQRSILHFLSARFDEALSLDELRFQVWGSKQISQTNLRVQPTYLKRKLRSPGLTISTFDSNRICLGEIHSTIPKR